jgi:hypothetical protein
MAVPARLNDVPGPDRSGGLGTKDPTARAQRCTILLSPLARRARHPTDKAKRAIAPDASDSRASRIPRGASACATNAKPTPRPNRESGSRPGVKHVRRLECPAGPETAHARRTPASEHVLHRIKAAACGRRGAGLRPPWRRPRTAAHMPPAAPAPAPPSPGGPPPVEPVPPVRALGPRSRYARSAARRLRSSFLARSRSRQPRLDFSGSGMAAPLPDGGSATLTAGGEQRGFSPHTRPQPPTSSQALGRPPQ